MTTTPATTEIPHRGLAVAALLAAAALTAVAVLYRPPAAARHSLAAPLALHGTDVSRQDWRPGYSIPDTAGVRRTPASFTGRVLLLSFGYTHCPDACPTTLARLAQVRQLLGANAGQVQVVFVTIDPARDKAALLQAYVREFDPGFIALRGNDDETDATATAFRADYHLLQQGKKIYVEHTVDTYLVDPTGRVRVVLPYQLTARQVADDVLAVLRDAGLCSAATPAQA
jgi:protein SCO1/2